MKNQILKNHTTQMMSCFPHEEATFQLPSIACLFYHEIYITVISKMSTCVICQKMKTSKKTVKIMKIVEFSRHVEISEGQISFII